MSLSSNITSLATRIATEFKTLKTLVSGNNQGDLSGLNTTAKTSIVAAINEVNANSGGGGGAVIDDTTPSTGTVYSSTKTDSEISSAVATVKSEILGGASAAFDTLLELETAVGDNDSAIGGLTTSIGEKVSYAQSQTLTTTQQAQARTNIDAAKASGDDGMGTVSDYVATFNAGLAA